jgi:flagellar biosynthetic protein FliR
VEVQLPQIAGEQLVAFVLVASRVAPLFMLAPVFASRMIPDRVKVVAAGVITVALVPIASEGMTIPEDVLGLGSVLLKEVAVGLVFAFAIGVISAAIQAGASLLDTIIGFSFAAILDPVTGHQSAVLAQFYSVFALAIFLIVGGDHMMIMGLAKSYEIVPLDVFPSFATITGLAAQGFASVLVVALQIAAPVVLTLVLVDAALGLMARAVPQMNVFIVGLPAKIILSFAAIAASLPLLGNFFQSELERSIGEALRVLGVG